MLAISTDDLKGAEYAVAEFGAQYPVLYTAKDATVPRQYGVFDLHGDGLASASVFIIDKAGQLRWTLISRAYTDQVSGGTILDQIRQIAGDEA